MQPQATFADFDLDERIQSALEALGFDTPTPIQAASIQALLDGRSMLGRARTGSGKTGAFGIPLIERAKEGSKRPKGLVIAPTRELALQVTDALRTYAKNLPIRVLCVYGGASYTPQLKGLRDGVPVVVGTPGRLLDLLDKGALKLDELEMFVMDEADEMLQMGFIDDVERLLEASPESCQKVLFSATMPSEIERIASRYMTDAEDIKVDGSGHSVDHIQQFQVKVPNRHKVEALCRVLDSVERDTALVFCRTRKSCAEVADALIAKGIAADALHGDLAQSGRERVLHRLRTRSLKVVVATDVAARGIDVEHITHVVNFDLPQNTETYVHRIGRTGRAGREGTAISFFAPADRHKVKRLQRDLKVKIPMIEIPTDAELVQRKQALLLTSVRDGGTDSQTTAVREWLESEELDIEWKDLAVAAIGQLARIRGLDLTRTPDAEPPPWARRKAPGERPPRRTDDVEIFLPVGRHAGIRPGDLMGAIANDTNTPGDQIGRITLLDRKSFVGVAKEAAERILREYTHLDIRGNQVPISAARPRRPYDGDDRRPRRSYDGDDRRPRKPGFRKPRGGGGPGGFKRGRKPGKPWGRGPKSRD